MRLGALVRKEFLQIVRDPSSIAIAFLMPLFLLALFGYGVSLDAERGFAAGLGASCRSPVAAHATVVGGDLQLAGLVGSQDGTAVYADAVAGPATDAARLGSELAAQLVAAGAGALL